MNTNEVTIRDILDYILQNRGTGNAFRNWPRNNILVTLKEAADMGMLLYYANSRNEIDGILCFRHVAPQNKNFGTTLWVTAALTTHPDALPLLIKRAMFLYPNVTHAACYRTSNLTGNISIKLYPLKTLCRILKIA